jgi:hypothetical protein
MAPSAICRFYFNDMKWVLDKSSNVEAESEGTPTSTIRVSGDQVANADRVKADGYVVYRSTTEGSGYEYKGTIPKPSDPNVKWEYRDNGSLVSNTTYHYRVYAYTKQAGLGEYADVSAETTTPPTSPRLGWGTYLGSASADHAFPVAVDSDGNIFVTGYAFSPAWTAGGLGSGGGRDAFVAKLSSDGTRLLWARRLGGNAEEYGRGIAVDSAGNAYVAGVTRSTNWLTDGMNSLGRQSGDGYVIKLSADGQILWSKCVDGGGYDDLYDISVAPGGDLLVSGTTNSSGSGYHGGGDALVARLRETSTNTAKVVWQRDLGGRGLDVGHAVRAGSDGSVYVTGYTQSSDWSSVLPGTTFHGVEDAFVAKLDPTGQQVAWVQFVGGSSTDRAFNVAVDKQGNVFIAGRTSSFGWTQGAHSSNYHGGEDAFVAKLNPTGTVAWSTCLGGSNRDYAVDIVVDGTGNALVVGTTTSAGWAFGGPDITLDGEDMFVAKMSNDGRTLWSTFLGGSGSDSGYGIALDGRGDAVIAGGTQSSNWNTYSWASTGYLQSRPGGEDAYVVKLLGAEVTSLRTRTSCPVDIEITDPNGRVVSKTINEISNATYVEADLDGDGDLNDEILIPEPLNGQYAVRVIPEPGADPQKTVTLVVQDRGVSTVLLDEVRVAALPAEPMNWGVDRLPPVLTITPAPALLPGGTWVTLHVDVQVQDNASPDPQVALIGIQPSWDTDGTSVIRAADYGEDDRDVELLAARGPEERYYTLLYAASDASGNVTYATAQVYVGNAAPVVDAGPNWNADEGYSVSFDGTASSDGDGDPLMYLWDFGDGSMGTGATPAHVYPDQGTYVVTLTADDGFYGGAASDTLNVTVNNVDPVAADETYEVAEDGYLDVVAPGVLLNDTDIPADPLSGALVTGPAYGALHFNSDGSFSYEPDQNFNGTDHFVYMADDGDGGTATATVTITVWPVNDLPTLDPIDDLAVLEDSLEVVVPLTGISPGQGDTEPVRITALSSAPEIIPNPTVVYVVPSVQGSLRFTPVPNANGIVVITVTVEDGGEDGNLETPGDNAMISRQFSVQVLPVQDPPLASADEYSATENETLVVSAPGVLSNDADVDGDELHATLITATSHGVLQLLSDGSFTYTPNNEFNREDVFTYVVSDGIADSQPVTVQITIDTACSWHNGLNPLNVNDDGFVSPIDALLIVNALNRGEAGKLPVDRPRPLTTPFYDTNRDGFLSPIDALLVINYLNRGGGEGEADNTGSSEIGATTWWTMAANTETHELGSANVSHEERVGGSRVEDSRPSTSVLQSLDLLFAKLDDAHGTKNCESTPSRREVSVGDLEEFLESMLRGNPDEGEVSAMSAS